MRKLKILYYNWIDFEYEPIRGGGASIYQRNLVDAARRHGDEVWFLSSGFAQSPFSRRPFLHEVKARRDGVRKFEIVNSTILSPGHWAFRRDVTRCPEMEPLFADFLREHGPFDVIHFNNLEGIPLSFLRLAREHYPSVQIVFSMHNYFAFCPQVNLWFQERALCRDFRDGRKCVSCLTKPFNPLTALRLYRLEYALKMLGISPHSLGSRFAHTMIFGFLRSAVRLAKRIYHGTAFGPMIVLNPTCGSVKPTKPTALLDPADAARFAARRRHFVAALNTYVDRVLTVSERVGELAVGFGVDAAKVRTLYIGTRFADGTHPAADAAGSPANRQRPLPGNGGLRIGYLGYMRRDKGFYFFEKALKEMPEELASRLAVTIAARIENLRAYKRIKRMAHRFASVAFYDGYTHSQFRDILGGLDLAVVPVLWEDNLPQIAMECVASGVAILTSNRGGAQELLRCPELVFRAGSYTDFYAKLQGIVENPAILSTALAGRARLYTPWEHYDYLREKIYCTAPGGTATARPNLAVAATTGEV